MKQEANETRRKETRLRMSIDLDRKAWKMAGSDHVVHRAILRDTSAFVNLC
ncbi:MAG: hypothetical protein CM1200mP2_03670 [Planctomycetaceae bacterium]|nr:MAG: hypothetical protein CM1200mP2_03670 [Planctomycetaceae bacterium]